eukprot:5605059-Prymnesium_polylepis.2
MACRTLAQPAPPRACMAAGSRPAIHDPCRAPSGTGGTASRGRCRSIRGGAYTCGPGRPRGCWAYLRSDARLRSPERAPRTVVVAAAALSRALCRELKL